MLSEIARLDNNHNFVYTVRQEKASLDVDCLSFFFLTLKKLEWIVQTTSYVEQRE